MTKKIVLAFTAIAALSACSIDPKDYETAPVTVQSAQGPVVCQLYTKSMVRWDRSITRPEGMSVANADAICLKEGQKEKSGTSTATKAPAAKEAATL